MGMDNLLLYVATYDTAAAATEDYRRLQDAKEADLELVSSVVVHRDDDGKVTVDEHGTGQVGSGALIGGAAGLVVGLFAPPLLAATAVGAGVGAIAGKLAERHEEKKMGVDLEETLPKGSSAIVAVIDDRYLDRIDAALDKSLKQVQKAIDRDDYEALQKAIDEGGDAVARAMSS
ncbi:putative membrane protein [Agromyces flavus]|uniref:Membrane protein n=1 Tax=Agromyces flavus TaxID=589382 RepID=A0A1H1ZNQ8_9MICO|nr:DUF1269 domain-containing protein [Agromyces flavus]MCP2367183.1 putative membrane protein [Agromyces flavus]GGI46235.1 hypothetical protein GCM10010932_13580 [Agromyces flavus]SDT35310.1 Uncharacterized membrane protein [Agromyces flavus]